MAAPDSPFQRLFLENGGELVHRNVARWLTAADLWKLAQVNRALSKVVATSYHDWLRNAPMHHRSRPAAGGVQGGQVGQVEGEPPELRGSLGQGLPIAMLATALGLGCSNFGYPQPAGSPQWAAFRALHRRYSSPENAVPRYPPLVQQDINNRLRENLPGAWQSTASHLYDYLANELPAWLSGQPLAKPVREALAVWVWAMFVFMCDLNEKETLYYEVPGYQARIAVEGFSAVTFREQNEVDMFLKKPGENTQFNPMTRSSRISKFIDRCWRYVWLFEGPTPLERLAGFRNPTTDRAQLLRAPPQSDLSAFFSTQEIASKASYPRILLNLIAKADFRTLLVVLVSFGGPTRNWQGYDQAQFDFLVQALQAAGAQQQVADLTKSMRPGKLAVLAGRRWAVTFFSETGAPHLDRDGRWKVGSELHDKLREVVVQFGGELRNPV